MDDRLLVEVILAVVSGVALAITLVCWCRTLTALEESEHSLDQMRREQGLLHRRVLHMENSLGRRFSSDMKVDDSEEEEQ